MEKMMSLSLLFSLFLSFILVFIQPSTSVGLIQGKKILFVFGDSYVDTGNWKETSGSCWKPPYGITFPGKPAGRFSDGRILTDFIASYMNITTPTPYERINSSSKLQFGVNFAFGGTGVFDTDVSQPNMTSQINLFENLISQNKFYTKTDLQSSIALVSLAGNDYANYLKQGSQLKLKEFTKSVINQLVLDIERIHKIGVTKILVTGIEPFGCLPIITSFSGYKNCSQSLNDVSLLHNKLLQKSLKRLNKNTTPKQQNDDVFYMLDLYGAFLSTLQKHIIQSGKLKNEYSLRPCCEGITGDFGCGSNEGGQAKYALCHDPNKAFFWDTVHLTQNGWYQVYNFISPTLRNLF